MLDGVLKGDLKLNRNINKYLDLCLKCDKCSNFCPSSIDVCKILETAKYNYEKKQGFQKNRSNQKSVLFNKISTATTKMKKKATLKYKLAVWTVK